MKLKGKVAVVTGGARDIGRAVSLKLAKEGAKVVVNYCNNYDDAVITAKLIQKLNGEVIIVQGDVTKLTDINNLAVKTIAAFGDKVDILVNVAGGFFGRKKIDEIDEEFYHLLMDVNFKSCVFMTQAFKPYLVSGASIVNFASQAGRDGGGPGASIYAASKGAVATFTRSMAKELGSLGIRVNAVNPGMIATKFHDDFTKNEVRKKVAAATPLEREGSANEVADLVSYLVSEQASFLTGNDIDINGGLAFS
ncbi:3-oxoacyl-[acyl-carrier protein] reductase [Wenyingzhuangia heitensis]|uniref:3-oxoacyl-[acyl-carrier protein] reductase n=1 Tax=Wenyingzhuangia heitensis TaxID=1487859 RepID=A0ABX0UFG7_9FLAO|nr:SDR family oxidoreductase [Wenyingzhuangia heitensis]NIJ45752.1 3-oxoacyl-[acyl-carrier protein] reductase [Wenyingzhuangia heitensis]